MVSAIRKSPTFSPVFAPVFKNGPDFKIGKKNGKTFGKTHYKAKECYEMRKLHYKGRCTKRKTITVEMYCDFDSDWPWTTLREPRDKAEAVLLDGSYVWNDDLEAYCVDDVDSVIDYANEWEHGEDENTHQGLDTDVTNRHVVIREVTL